VQQVWRVSQAEFQNAYRFCSEGNSCKQGHTTTIDNDNNKMTDLLPHLTTSTLLPPTPTHPQPSQYWHHHPWLQMNHLVTNNE
jgi:hypothetical protein